MDRRTRTDQADLVADGIVGIFIGVSAMTIMFSVLWLTTGLIKESVHGSENQSVSRELNDTMGRVGQYSACPNPANASSRSQCITSDIGVVVPAASPLRPSDDPVLPHLPPPTPVPVYENTPDSQFLCWRVTAAASIEGAVSSDVGGELDCWLTFMQSADHDFRPLGTLAISTHPMTNSPDDYEPVWERQPEQTRLVTSRLLRMCWEWPVDSLGKPTEDGGWIGRPDPSTIPERGHPLTRECLTPGVTSTPTQPAPQLSWLAWTCTLNTGEIADCAVLAEEASTELSNATVDYAQAVETAGSLWGVQQVEVHFCEAVEEYSRGVLTAADFARSGEFLETRCALRTVSAFIRSG